jgi:hypothetical protein
MMTMENIMTNETKRASSSKPETLQAPKQCIAPAKTKKAKMIAMLSRKSGADVPSLSTTLGWLPHTTRAALSGLRKAGYEITSIKAGNGKPMRYQIIGSPKADVS